MLYPYRAHLLRFSFLRGGGDLSKGDADIRSSSWAMEIFEFIKNL